jgi:hypothetical protein
MTASVVIPAKAGTQSLHKTSGEASKQRARLGPGLRRDDEFMGRDDGKGGEA